MKVLIFVVGLIDTPCIDDSENVQLACVFQWLFLSKLEIFDSFHTYKFDEFVYMGITKTDKKKERKNKWKKRRENTSKTCHFL